MDIINYASGFIPNVVADDKVLYQNIKAFNPNFSIQYIYNRMFVYNSNFRVFYTSYDIEHQLSILEDNDYVIQVFDDRVILDIKDPETIARQLEIMQYKIYDDQLIILEDNRINIDIDIMYDLMRYQSLFSTGYIHKSLDGIYYYYHTPEPINIEKEYSQYHLDYLKEFNITMYTIAEEQYYLYTLARELPNDLKYILEYRDDILSIIYQDDSITINIKDYDSITIDNGSIDIFKSLIANLYHGNTIYDYYKIVSPNKAVKTYRLQDI